MLILTEEAVYILFSLVFAVRDTLEGCYIALDHEKNNKNADENFQIRRVLVFAPHPQPFFYEPVGSALSKRQDVLTWMIARMAATDFECRDQYFANKLWRQHMPGSIGRAIANGEDSLDSAERFDREFQELQLNDAFGPLDESSVELFNELSHSNESLRVLTTEVLRSWPEYEKDHAWKSVADFPEPV